MMISSGSLIIKGGWDGIGFGFLIPGHVLCAVVSFFHGDAFFHRADQSTKVATHTIFVYDFRNSIAIILRNPDGLVCPIIAGNVTQIAPYAFAAVNIGYDFILKIEVFPLRYIRERFALEIINGFITLVDHKLL